jgi:hypothetical protein
MISPSASVNKSRQSALSAEAQTCESGIRLDNVGDSRTEFRRERRSPRYKKNKNRILVLERFRSSGNPANA